MTTPTDPTTLRTALEALVRMNDRMRGDGPPIYEAEANDILAAARAALATPAPAADEARCGEPGCPKPEARYATVHATKERRGRRHPFQPAPTPAPPTPPATEERDKHRGHDIRAGYGQMVCHTCYPAPTPAPSTPPATEPVAALAALESVTHRRDCPHGHHDVVHVAPAHFDGPACPHCSDAEYADRMQREEPCPVCAALASPTLARALTIGTAIEALVAVTHPLDHIVIARHRIGAGTAWDAYTMNNTDSPRRRPAEATALADALRKERGA